MQLMQLIINQESANEAKDHRKMQYFIKNGVWKQAVIGDTKVVYNNFVSLGDNLAPNLVDQMVGNSSLTYLDCSECHIDIGEAMLFGVGDYDSEYCYLCKDCLAKALDLF